MKRVGLYLGCNIPFRRPDVEYSMRYALKALDFEVVDLEGAACCPAFGSMPSVDLLAWCVGSAWNLSIAEEKGLEYIVTGCGSCYGSLNEAKYHMEKHPEIKQKVNEILSSVGKKYEGKVKVYNFYNLIYDLVGLDELKRKVKFPLKGLICGAQPGCHNLWPEKVFPANDENTFQPKRLREICEALGGEAPWYSTITDCCGMGALGTLAKDKSETLFIRKIKTMLEEINPELYVVGCSSCLLRGDNRQAVMKKEGKIDFELPAVHIAQLVALALGAEPEKVLGLTEVPIEKVLEKIRGGA
ncbi:MAG: CoB--CoM heterodisulfide reductase iron-sulfur subunit B family protein [Thermodesulfobacteriaceae bacterium]|nr:CoB--CoM heterodisulfide reductase iron-sulfur subunit B family protein [Thermodesulfobacteriaceae bacterium]MCX8041881.1 CoB--CoM heterodisulfide reductase iron-sulfur subunit B family protein [Thermodesulfobacteriaceae bacterium]MDW8135722.1 CoB--CoM heterodisulfide reductase iron-sulfur subunit B family protein [Thermodesulfobacterium sp.]